MTLTTPNPDHESTDRKSCVPADRTWMRAPFVSIRTSMTPSHQSGVRAAMRPAITQATGSHCDPSPMRPPSHKLLWVMPPALVVA